MNHKPERQHGDTWTIWANEEMRQAHSPGTKRAWSCRDCGLVCIETEVGDRNNLMGDQVRPFSGHVGNEGEIHCDECRYRSRLERRRKNRSRLSCATDRDILSEWINADPELTKWIQREICTLRDRTDDPDRAEVLVKASQFLVRASEGAYIAVVCVSECDSSAELPAPEVAPPEIIHFSGACETQFRTNRAYSSGWRDVTCGLCLTAGMQQLLTVHNNLINF